MGITEIFGKTFDIVKNNPKIILPYLVFTMIIGVFVIYSVFSSIGTIYSSPMIPGGAHTTPSLNSIIQVYETLVPVLVLIIGLSVFIAPLLLGAYIDIADQGYNRTKVSMSRAFDVAKKNYVHMFLTGLLLFIIWTVFGATFIVAFVLPIVISHVHLLTVLWLLLGCILFFILGIILCLLLYEAYAVVILEKLGAVEAVKRSIDIGKKNLGAIFAVIVVTVLISLGYSLVIGIAVSVIQIPLELSGNIFLGVGIGQFINFVFSSVLSSWIALIPVGFYKEYVASKSKKRIRK
ncbi:MAG: hypothetical protein ACHQX1_02600 [Candidatus Micrarchaeales archaeon]